MSRQVEPSLGGRARWFALPRRREIALGFDSPEAGLTLIETIVALALAALVVAFLAQGTGLVRHFARLGRVISAQDETLAVRDHLRRTIESAMRSTDSTHRDAFAGTIDTAVFTVPGDRLLEVGGPVRVTLAAVVEGSQVSLVETRAPVGAPEEKGRTRRLVTGAGRMQFAYYGVMGGKPVWLPEWTDPGASPTLLRIDVVFPQSEVRRWPPFIVLMPTGGSTEFVPAAGSSNAAAAKPATPG